MTTHSRARVIALTAFGVEVRIHVDGSRADELVKHLIGLWGWCGATEVEAHGGTAASAFLDEDPAAVAAATARGAVAGDDLDALSEAVTSAVTLHAIQASEGRLLMLRAAAVAHPVTGRCVILAGPPGSGKSSVARALTRYFAYVTDETVALTRSLDVLPYPKPMSLLVDGVGPGKQQFSPAELDVQRSPGVVRPAAVFMLDRRHEGFVPPVVTELPIDEALAHLAGETSLLASLDRPLHYLADLVHSVGGVQRVTYSEADDLVALTQQVLNNEAPHLVPEPTEPEPTLAELHGGPPVSGGQEVVRRRKFTDCYVEDGVGCVMVDGNVAALSVMATRIVTLLGDDEASVVRLADALVAEFGTPDSGDPVALVEGHVSDLVEVGVLERAGQR